MHTVIIEVDLSQQGQNQQQMKYVAKATTVEPLQDMNVTRTTTSTSSAAMPSERDKHPSVVVVTETTCSTR